LTSQPNQIISKCRRLRPANFNHIPDGTFCTPSHSPSSDRNSRVEEDLLDQLFNSSEKPLARTLLLSANAGKQGRPQPMSTKISQETLAKMVGTTRPRVSFFMNKFRKLGFIDYNGDLQVHSSLLTVVLRD